MQIMPVLNDFPIGRYLAAVREDAKMTQTQLAAAVAFSTATLSRIESGEKPVTSEELASILAAINTPKAEALREFLAQKWDQVDRPSFEHPNRDSLWEANEVLRKLAALRQDPDLKAIFLRQVDLYEEQVRRAVAYLQDCMHQISFIGSIGVGKSTAICKLLGLLKPGEEKLDRQIVLETGAGGITLCEVHISHGPRFGLRIVPRTEESIRRDVEDFCDYLVKGTAENLPSEDGEEEEDLLGISKETVRAIRNMAGITEKRTVENGKRVRIDPAKELAKQYPSPQELCVHILTKMDLLRRNKRDEWCPETESPAHWLQEIFSAVNNGRHPEFTLPQKIEIVLPNPLLDSRELPIRVIDTKGIDQTAERQDLECHFDDPRTLVVLCSRFNDAPEVALQTLLRRAKEAGARNTLQKTVLLVLPRPEEALAVKYDDGARVDIDEEGYEVKADQINMRLALLGASEMGVEFFNAREESASRIRARLVEKITELRKQHARRITQLAGAVSRLRENRQDEQVRIIFERAMSHLNTWIKRNREVRPSDAPLQEPLVTAIENTRYASTVRASVRRHGDWYNLDYYHHLAYGVRRLAVAQIGAKLVELKVIIGNLAADEELSAAKEFMDGIVARVDARADEAYLRIQAAGREAFIQFLSHDHEFWSRCGNRWGRGPGYRTAIRDMTESEIETQADEVEAVIQGLIAMEWSKIVAEIEALLQQHASPAPDSNALTHTSRM
jgi:transcriptional regulator with XRE-family HTH domain